ncbi:MAG TPA: hypothetical protein VHA82_11035 [Ramlibacter sp.]|uniref:hypothetical protein n=1 Tax=Ramlibacter sp. TaxID=1917967 RepID=UPI002B687BFE|nr:hypothetical protein [Ramlibacter sp.]HVZ44334.1 hypothetical protein [Ramlibacter sp.]
MHTWTKRRVDALVQGAQLLTTGSISRASMRGGIGTAASRHPGHATHLFQPHRKTDTIDVYHSRRRFRHSQECSKDIQ